MRAAILAVGSELLGTDRLDTNSLRLTEVLQRYGVELVAKGVVGDDRGRIAGEARRLAELAELVLVTGGLGPTADDLTREGVADGFGLALVLAPEIVGVIEERFRAFGRRMPEVNRKQAMVPPGATVIDNPRGSAPGLRLEAGGATLFLFPGVPQELEGMIDSDLVPWLAERTGGTSLDRGVLKIACLPESEVEERIAPAYDEFGRESITILAHPGEIELHFHASGAESERRQRVAAIAARLRELAGPAVYTDHPDARLETVVGELLARRGATLVTAESCTGGLLAERITRVAGSSAWFLGGAVSYSNELKRKLLGVPEELLAEHGAVSEAVARAMAEGACERLGGDYGIAVTGIAGPSGGTEDKPVGTVHLALSGPATDGDGIDTSHRRVRFLGDRRRIRGLTVQLALELLRRRLLAGAGGDGAAGEYPA